MEYGRDQKLIGYWVEKSAEPQISPLVRLGNRREVRNTGSGIEAKRTHRGQSPSSQNKPMIGKMTKIRESQNVR